MMETGNPDTPHLKGPCSSGAQNPTPASPECCLQSYFLPFRQTPIKHTNGCREFLGWFVFFSVDLLVCFLFQILKKAPGLCGAPHAHPFSHTHCPSSHSKSTSRTALFPHPNNKHSVLSLFCRTRGVICIFHI